jgi:hypothetical protein
MVHSVMGGSDQWEHQAALGKDRDLNRVDLSSFGHNADMSAINSIAGFAVWVLLELDRQDVYPFDLLGHSWAG